MAPASCRRRLEGWTPLHAQASHNTHDGLARLSDIHVFWLFVPCDFNFFVVSILPDVWRTASFPHELWIHFQVANAFALGNHTLAACTEAACSMLSLFLLLHVSLHCMWNKRPTGQLLLAFSMPITAWSLYKSPSLRLCISISLSLPLQALFLCLVCLLVSLGCPVFASLPLLLPSSANLCLGRSCSSLLLPFGRTSSPLLKALPHDRPFHTALSSCFPKGKRRHTSLSNPRGWP